MTFYEIKGDIHLGNKAPDGSQFRPHVVWFGETVTMIEEAAKAMSTADVFILVEISLQVYTAAGLIEFLLPGIPKCIIDKNPPYVPPHRHFIVIKKLATEGVERLKNILIESKD